MNLKDLRAANIKRDREWDPLRLITPAFRAVELGGEVGEMLNVAKKLMREEMGMRGSRATVDDLSEELADILICLDLLAMQFEIDLSLATVKKFNETSEKYNLKTKFDFTSSIPPRRGR